MVKNKQLQIGWHIFLPQSTGTTFISQSLLYFLYHNRLWYFFLAPVFPQLQNRPGH